MAGSGAGVVARPHHPRRRLRQADRRGTSRLGVASLALLTTLLVGTATACITPTPPDGFAIYGELGDGQVALHWTPAASAPAGYDVQLWRNDQPMWTNLPSVVAPTAVVTDVVDEVTYQFRVRTAAAPGVAAGVWSSPVTVVYVDPVLPVVRISTAGRAPIVGTETYVSGQVSIDPNGSPFAAYSGSMQIKGRGNSTANLPKRPYKIKLDTKSSLMGMPTERDWVLLANYQDKSQLRTLAAGLLGGATDLAWTPDTRFVEVVLNGAYQGVYQLAEQVEVSAARVGVDAVKPTDVAGEALTGGYLLEVDQRLAENHEPGFVTSHDVPVVIKDPDPAAPVQSTYIRDYVQSFEHALYSPGFADPATGYRAYLDVDSFIDWYLVQELTKNQDTMFSSSFLYKPRGQRLSFGPLWDFDISMGSSWSHVPPSPEGWWVRRGDILWIPRFFQDPTFVDRLEQRWDTFRTAFDDVPAALELQGASLQGAIANDAAAWRYTLATSEQPASIAAWLSARIAWMDAQFHDGGV